MFVIESTGMVEDEADTVGPRWKHRERSAHSCRVIQGWENGQFVAVQWRTETSVGNLTDCYFRYVQPTIEEHRKALGLTLDQVFFNTDLVGQASTTYNSSVSTDGSSFDHC